MKRSRLERRTPLTADPGKQAEWRQRTARNLPAISKRRRREQSARNLVREQVHIRAGGACEYASVVPEVTCGFLPGRSRMEVDELRGGSFRSVEYLDVERCRLTCPVHHDWKTAHKRDVLRRLGEDV